MTIFLLQTSSHFSAELISPKSGHWISCVPEVLQNCVSLGDDRPTSLKSANGVIDALQGYVKDQASGTANLGQNDRQNVRATPEPI